MAQSKELFQRRYKVGSWGRKIRGDGELFERKLHDVWLHLRFKFSEGFDTLDVLTPDVAGRGGEC